MTEYRASRTLVKSPPELWSEVSEASSLRRHLDQFGEIRITELEPETAVAWEGEGARGTVRLEPAGWGTRVILTADPGCCEDPGPERVPQGAIEAEARELTAALELGRRGRGRGRIRERSLLGVILRWWRGGGAAREAVQAPELGPEQPSGQPSGAEPADPRGSAAAPALALSSALESLGRAHHRPYSRA